MSPSRGPRWPPRHSLGKRILVFSAGRLSRLLAWGGRDAELPSDRLPLFIDFSQGDLHTAGGRGREQG